MLFRSNFKSTQSFLLFSKQYFNPCYSLLINKRLYCISLKDKHKNHNHTPIKINKQDNDSSYFNKLCFNLNNSCKNQSLETIISIISLEISSMFLVHSIIKSLPFIFPLEFAIAFGINRFTRRLRFPIDLIGAKILANIKPELTKVKIFGGIIKYKPSISNYKTIKILNNYGLCYLISSRYCSILSVFSIYFCLTYGIDLETFIDYLLSFSTSSSNSTSNIYENYWEKYNIGEIAGSWAASVVVSNIFCPFVYLFSPYPASVLYYIRKKIYDKIKKN